MWIGPHTHIPSCTSCYLISCTSFTSRNHKSHTAGTLMYSILLIYSSLPSLRSLVSSLHGLRYCPRRPALWFLILRLSGSSVLPCSPGYLCQQSPCPLGSTPASSLSAGFHFSKFRATWILLQRLLEFRAQDPMS